jgi:methylase of polypeptide subunit release factors
VVPLKTLLGVLGAAEWRKKGLAVPGLEGKLVPHYGVYTPTRSEYVELVAAIPEVQGKRVFDVGTGSGVLAFVLLQHGAARAVATDVDSRALACARENAVRLGLADRFETREVDGFPDGTADLVVCNPPWIPEPPKTRLDRAVFDEGGRFLTRFLEGLASHLAPGGRGTLVLSDLAVHLGLRAPDWLERELERVGLRVAWTKAAAPTHGKAKDQADPLHAARAKEVTTLYALVPK